MDAALKPDSLKVDETITTNDSVVTEWTFEEKYQDSDHATRFKTVKREVTKKGITFAEAVQRGSDYLDVIPDIFLAGALEQTVAKSQARQFANQYGAPEGQPKFWYRKHSRWLTPQIVGEDDEIKARKGEISKEALDFPTIGDSVAYTWQSIKDIPLNQVDMDLRAIGAMIGLTEDRIVMNALYNATSTDNFNVYSYATESVSYIEFLKWKARIGAPTADSHPEMPALMRDALVNMYDPSILIVPPAQYEAILTDTTLLNQTFWHNSQVLDRGAIKTGFGLTIYRLPTGYYDEKWEWHPEDAIYLIDPSLGGVDLVTKEPLQVVNWDIYANRRSQTMLYERCNAVVRNPRSVFKLELNSPYGA